MANWEYPQTASSGAIENYLATTAANAINGVNSTSSSLRSLSIPDSATPNVFTPFDFNSISIVMPTVPTSVTITLPNLSGATPDLPTLTSLISAPSIPALAVLDFSGKPVLPTLNSQLTAPVTPTLTATDLSGAKPDLPVLTMDVVAADLIITDLINTIKTELYARLYGSSAIENALFNRSLDRINAQATGLFEKTKSALSSSGWSRQTGNAQTSVEEIFLKAGTEQVSDANRDVMLAQYEAMQRVYDQIISLEGNLINAKAGDENNKIQVYSAGWQSYIENIKVNDSLNHTKIDLYSNQVQAYSAASNSNTGDNSSKVQLYNAGLQGYIENLKINNDANHTKIDLYGNQVQAYSASSSATNNYNSSKVQLYGAEWDGWVNNVKIYNDVNQILISKYGADIQGFVASAKVKSDEAQILLAKISALDAAHAQMAQVNIETIKMTNAYNIGKFSAYAESYKAIGAMNAGLANSCINGMNISYSFGFSEGHSESHAFEA